MCAVSLGVRVVNEITERGGEILFTLRMRP
jgi:hypothetical protein